MRERPFLELHERLNLRVKSMGDELDRRVARDQEQLEAKMSDMEASLSREIQSLREDIESLSADSSPKASSGPRGGKKGTANLLKGMPELDEEMLSQGMEQLAPILGLDAEQKKKVEEILQKRIGEVNKLRKEVESGERNVNDGVQQAQKILDQLVEETKPILDETQQGILEQLVTSLTEQAAGAM